MEPWWRFSRSGPDFLKADSTSLSQIKLRLAVVTFVLGELTSLELADFNHQNALMGLSIGRCLDGHFRLELDPENGLSGVVEGRTLEISIEPGIAAGGRYLKLG